MSERAWPGQATNEPGELEDEDEHDNVDDEAGAVEHGDTDDAEELVVGEVVDDGDIGDDEEEKEAGK